MLAFVLHVAVTALLLVVVAKLIDGIDVEGFGAALLAVLVLGLVNAFLRPIAVILALPLNLVTFGLLWWLIRWVINALMLWVAAAIVPGFKVRGFAPAFWGALLLTLGNLLIGWLF
jgi:putative membrane protein